MTGSIYDWTISPDSNATNDGDINWQEFQDPATVNNSSRRMMGRLAEFLDDLAPSRLSTGGSNVYQITAASTPVTVAPPDGFMVSFIAHQANAGASVLVVNTFSNAPLRAVSGQNLPKGAIQPGMIITAFFKAATNEYLALGTGANVQAYLAAFQSVDLTARLMKVGTVLPWPGGTLPGGYLYASGGTQLIASFPELYAAYGTLYGGDGVTTFGIPDYRGRSLFGRDDMGGTAANRITTAASGINGATLGAVGGAQTVTIARSDLPNTALGGTTDRSGNHQHTVPFIATGSTTGPGPSAIIGFAGGNTNSGQGGDHDHNIITDSMNGGVTQTAVNKLPPTAICNWIIFASPPLAAAGALGTNGLQYVFDAGTTDADPGVGKLRFDNPSPGSATHIYLSKTDAVGALQTLNLTNVFGSASGTKGTVLINKVGGQGNCFSCLVTAIDTSQTNYVRLTIQNPSINGAFAAADSLGVQTSRTGDPGSQGSLGAITLTNGLNSNIALPANTGVRITGPTGSFSVGGFASGIDGQLLRLTNMTSQAMTIKNEDSSSASANRIDTLTGADMVLRTSKSSATFQYDGTEQRWCVVATN